MTLPAYVTRSYSGKAQATTLLANIGPSDTTFGIAAPSSWVEAPGNVNHLGTSGPFVVSVDYNTTSEEKILCSSIDLSSGTVTVYGSGAGRGYDGTSAQSHSSTALAVVVFAAVDADEANYAMQQTVGQITTAGDLLVGSGANALSRLGIGTNGQYLGVASGTVGWVSPTSKIFAKASATGTFASSTSAAQRITGLAFNSGYPNPSGSLTIPAGTDRITTTVAGTYRVIAQLTAGNMADNGVSGSKINQFNLVKTSGGTNTVVSTAAPSVSGAYLASTANITDLVYLNAGDQIGMTALNNQSSYASAYSASGTFLIVEYVSA